MALIVEDGSGKSDADSLCSVAFADTYHAGMGNTAWAALNATTAKEPALRKATQIMLGRFRGRWKGSRVKQTQALDWPRYDVVVDDYPLSHTAIPADLVRAVAEYALVVSAGTDLAAPIGPAVISKTVGPISVTYAQGASQVTKYPAAEMLLGQFLDSSAGMIKVTRS